MESIVVAIITGVVALAGVIMSNSKSRAVMECKIDSLAEKVARHNQLIERTYELERSMAIVRSDVESLKGNTGELEVDGFLGVQSVTAWQRALGTVEDGLMGPQTVRCLQAWLGARGYDCGPIDGVLGRQTAMAVQRSLNAGAWSR